MQSLNVETVVAATTSFFWVFGHLDSNLKYITRISKKRVNISLLINSRFGLRSVIDVMV